MQYLVIGAGPAGLQLGYLLGRAGRDYQILEAGPAPGTFFRTFPRHRRMISINKAHTGWDDAEQQIALSDGGAGLEEFFRKNFPLATVILDFWHAKEHLVELAKAVFGEGSDEGQVWLDERCHQLKHSGGAAVLAELEALDVSSRSDAVREAQRRETNYFRNHQHKMDYPRYLANGWQIGSGPVESACKTVVNFRLCGIEQQISVAK